jgi:hypothetical protein
MLPYVSYRSTAMQLNWNAPRAERALKTAAALKSAAIEHKEQITNWLGVLMLLAVGVVWL